MLPGLTHEEARDLVLSVGTHHGRRRLSPLEVAELFQKALTSGATLQECAHFVNLTGPAMISRFVRLLRLSAQIRHMVDWGQTGATMAFAAAWRLAELGEDEQEAVVREIIANEMTREEVRQLVQLKKRSRRRMEECVSEVLRMRPAVTKHHVFLGAVTDEDTRQGLAKLKQGERDEVLASALTETYGVLPKTSGRLGIERFTIVTDEEGAARLKLGGGPGFEVAINQSLATKVSKI